MAVPLTTIKLGKLKKEEVGAKINCATQFCQFLLLFLHVSQHLYLKAFEKQLLVGL